MLVQLLLQVHLKVSPVPAGVLCLVAGVDGGPRGRVLLHPPLQENLLLQIGLPVIVVLGKVGQENLLDNTPQLQGQRMKTFCRHPHSKQNVHRIVLPFHKFL